MLTTSAPGSTIDIRPYAPEQFHDGIAMLPHEMGDIAAIDGLAGLVPRTDYYENFADSFLIEGLRLTDANQENCLADISKVLQAMRRERPKAGRLFRAVEEPISVMLTDIFESEIYGSCFERDEFNLRLRYGRYDPTGGIDARWHIHPDLRAIFTKTICGPTTQNLTMMIHHPNSEEALRLTKLYMSSHPDVAQDWIQNHTVGKTQVMNGKLVHREPPIVGNVAVPRVIAIAYIDSFVD